MTVYVDRNIFHINAELYKNDRFHVIPLEDFNCHLNKYDTTYIKNNENNQMNNMCSPEEMDYYTKVKNCLNGDLFHGDFFNGKRNAWGYYQWDNGDKYFGTFFNDKKHGYGYYVWSNGSTYLGTFYLDKRYGYGIMRYTDNSIYEGYFTDDYRYGPGILIEYSINSLQINIGYWKNNRLIRLKKSILNHNNNNNNNNHEFQFNKTFSQYNFYQLINLQLMFYNNNNNNNQYEKSIKRHDFIDLFNKQYKSNNNNNNNNNNQYINELIIKNDKSINYLMYLIEILLKQSNLPNSYHVWNVNSPLCEKFIANYSFDCLLCCLPTIIEQLSIEQFNKFKQIFQPIQCIQNKYKNYTTNENTLFDLRFKQNQTVNLVTMHMKITQISYLQEFLRNSCQLINWSNIFNLVTMKDFTIQQQQQQEPGHHESHHNIDYCTTNQLLINDWSILWNKKMKTVFKKKIIKENQLKFNHTTPNTTDNTTNQLSIIGKYELMSIKFIQYCFNGLYDEVKHLLHSNEIYIDPNVMDSHGQFGLLGAVLTWNMKLVNLLLDFGANINQLTDDGLTVFTICLLKYYELFQEIMAGKNDQTNQNDYLSQKDYEQNGQQQQGQQQQQQQQQRQRHYQSNHILSIITKTVQDNENITSSNVINDNVETDEMKITDMNNSSLLYGRNYIYRVELPVLLSTTSSVSMVMLRRAARLSQIRRMHLNKIRASRSLIRKSNEIRKSFELSQNIEQTIEINHNLMSTPQTMLPSFQRFTNCLTRFNTLTDVKLKLSKEVLSDKILNSNNNNNNNKTNRSNSSRSKSSYQIKSRPKTISLDRRSKQLMIDNASNTAVINQPYTVTSSSLKEAAAYELSRNPYFLTSHSPHNSTKKYSLDENNNKTLDYEQLNTETSTSRSSLDQQALLLAKQKQMMDVIDLLLKRGANPNTGIRPLPALFLAVQAGDPDMVRKLIQHGADANICLRVDNPSKSENCSLTGIYIDEDEPPLMPSLDGLTVLHYAVLVPDEMGVQLTEILLKDGQADPNKQATLDDSFKLKNEYNAFIQTRSSSETSSGKSTPEVKKIHEGRTPLHLVCSREYDLPNSAIIAECLLRHNANPNLLCNGHSALSIAIAVGNDPCINVLINHENTNINQPLENGLGSALSIACSSLFEFRRSIESRLELIKQLINKGGLDSFKTFVISKQKGILGNVIDFTYMDYAKDTRIAKTPYHALNDIEKETYNGRMQILAYLADRLRNFAYSIEDTTDNEQITLDRIELHNKQINQKMISSPIKTYSSKLSRQESPTYLKQNSCIPYSFCYECGRSVGVRLVVCSRCRRVYFCSKVCKLKSWTTRHKNECYLTPELQAERNRRSPTKVQSDLKGNKQKNDQQLIKQNAKQQQFNVNLLLHHLTCCSSNGELIGVVIHPSYHYQYLLNHYMKTNENGHIIIGTYNGDGNYSLG
ncbi:hypothetical protein MN116_004495 [Schistosoma mekongi]|uniref:MYND-type domain-containing protein n=1 Tax=Schistosoma mekongi TaxID=38744 RepID=A0AAE2D6J3_SCHME|nr:hypothetical protein MN116_004495 [Schistosoma mekongi]